jgi:hypothetical protein
MKRYCLLLELIAFAIHPGDTQSTTTVCLEGPTSWLYVTSQNNFDFDGVNAGTVQGVLEYLGGANELYRGRQLKLEEIKSDFWEKHCALCSKEANTASKKSLEKIDNIYTDGVYHQLWTRFLNADYTAEEIRNLQRAIQHVAVVKDDSIFLGAAPEKTGFHGESRIIRALFIRDYPVIHLNKTNTYFALQQGNDIPVDVKQNARKWFKETLKGRPLAMGSSQGTCKGCAACLDEFEISHGPETNPPKQWLDPLTLSGYQGTTTITKQDRHHALFVAFKYIIH